MSFLQNSLEIVIDANLAAVVNFLLVVDVSRLMSLKSDFVDESWLIGANCALVNFLAIVVVNHVFLQMRFVPENLVADDACDFVHDMRVSEVIFKNA